MISRTSDFDVLKIYVAEEDPFAFLVVEQVILAKERQRHPEIMPLSYFASQRKRADHHRAIDSYEKVAAACNRLWLQLVERIMQVHVDETMLPHEARLRRKQRYEQHLDELQELKYQLELQLERERLSALPRPNMIASHEARLREIELEQKELNTAHKGETERVRQNDLVRLDSARDTLKHITEKQIRLNHRNQVTLTKLQNEAQERLQTLGHAHDYVMNAGKPDKDDKVYIATQGKEAFDVYIEMIRERWNAAKVDKDDQYHMEVKLLMDMVSKIL